MKNVFISQPMRGLTSNEIKANRFAAIKDIKKFVLNKYDEEVNIIDSTLKMHRKRSCLFFGGLDNQFVSYPKQTLSIV